MVKSAKKRCFYKHRDYHEQRIAPKKGNDSGMSLWKDIEGYEGLYLISDKGEVISLPRTVQCGDKIIHRVKKFIKPHLRGKNRLFYSCVTLTKDGISKSHSIHRLVAKAFIPNPSNLPEVNHIDKNPLNNDVTNLEWCDRQYNIDYSKSKAVLQMEDGKAISRFKSIAEAARMTGIKRTGINNVLTGWTNTAGGYQWVYCD